MCDHCSDHTGEDEQIYPRPQTRSRIESDRSQDERAYFSGNPATDMQGKPQITSKYDPELVTDLAELVTRLTAWIEWAEGEYDGTRNAAARANGAAEAMAYALRCALASGKPDARGNVNWPEFDLYLGE